MTRRETMEQWVTATELLGVKSIRGQMHKAVKDSRENGGLAIACYPTSQRLRRVVVRVVVRLVPASLPGVVAELRRELRSDSHRPQPLLLAKLLCKALELVPSKRSLAIWWWQCGPPSVSVLALRFDIIF